MGALWYRGSVYVCAPPSVWKFTDTNDDGVADKREELITRFGSNGNAADIHGPFLGPDGRLWWTDGRHGHSIERPDGPRLSGKAARVFRCRPDGSELEVVCGGGMDNPVEIAFTEEGEPLVTVALLHAQPRRVDSIIHAVEGGVFPYHDVLKEFKRSGDLLPSVVDLGWVAPSGLLRVRGGALPPGSYLNAQFNTHKVVLVKIEREGATFRGRVEEFLASEQTDFHPTDLVEDADGSLLVLDTGGWFRIGCPASRIEKPQAKGAIYRLRRKDLPRVEDPWGLRKDGTLDDPRFAVRDRATDQAKDPALLNSASPLARRHAVWGLSRNGLSVRSALKDRDVSVRQSALRAAGLQRDRTAYDDIVELLEDEVPAIRREAAVALARFRDPPAVPALLAALARGGDRFLEHALIWALIEIADPTATRQGLKSAPRGTLIALDQMEKGGLTREEATSLLAAADAPLQREVVRVLGERGWISEITGLLGSWLREAKPRPELGGTLAAFSADPGVQDLVARALRAPATSVDTRLALLEAMALAPPERFPATWSAELRWSLDHADARIVRLAVAAIRAGRVTDADVRLLELARETDRPEELRVDAALTIAARIQKLDAPLFGFLRECLNPARPAMLRLAAAQGLGTAGLSDEQRKRLIASLAEAGAMELPRLLPAFERGGTLEAGRALLAALSKSPAVESLPAETLKRVLLAFPEELRREAAPLLKRLEEDVEQQRARLLELAPVLKGGDPARGRDLFHGSKAACAACHRAGSAGGQVGPDLSKIGGIRAPQDLLESVVFPSLSFARGYEPVRLRTRDGLVLDGMVSRETPDALLLVQADRTERRVLRASIDELRQGRLSIMPQGLDAALTREELADLLAFLVSLR